MRENSCGQKCEAEHDDAASNTWFEHKKAPPMAGLSMIPEPFDSLKKSGDGGGYHIMPFHYTLTY